jgi:hypothetical protein
MAGSDFDIIGHPGSLHPCGAAHGAVVIGRSAPRRRPAGPDKIRDQHPEPQAADQLRPVPSQRLPGPPRDRTAPTVFLAAQIVMAVTLRASTPGVP